MTILLAGMVDSACAAESRAVPFVEAEALFRQEPRWLGTDGAISTPLTDGRVFWTFDDSFVSTTPGGGREQSVMVRNSIAIQSGDDPRSAVMHFHWGTGADGGPDSFFPESVDAWYWTGAPIHLTEGPLLSFLTRTISTPGEGMGFANDGFALAVIDNPGDAVENWTYRIVPGKQTEFDAVPAAALVRQGEHVIGIAIKQKGTHAGALVRYLASDLAMGELGNAEWWAGDDQGWLAESDLGPAGPRYVIEDAGAECSVHWDASVQRYVHVATYGFGAAEIGLRFAEQLTGPWSEPQMVYRPPESDVPGLLVYGAMAHPELSGPEADELLVTYATNSSSFEDLLSSQDIYWPRVVRVRLTLP